MFEEIKERVAEGRFIIVGGWHVQPDCNLPSGEAFARQSLYAQRYFHKTFGITARVGYNVDSFGHNGMMPQILRKSGMDCYIFMRPGPHEKELDSDIFEWVSPDGSSVTTYRLHHSYCNNFESAEDLEETIAKMNNSARTALPILPVFYGVGNHGGGPTIRNLELLREYAQKEGAPELIYSDIQDFFDDARSCGAGIPKLYDDLQHHAAGCYSTVTRIKNGIRRAEQELICAESFQVLAGSLCAKKHRTARFREAWENVCFCHFHDSMDGCSIREVYDNAANMIGMARNIAAVEENNALQTLSWIIDTDDRSKGLPVVVFNPHSFDAVQKVQINRPAACVSDADGQTVLSQQVHASSYECYMKKDTLFEARVPALGYAVYYLSDDLPGEDSATAERTAASAGEAAPTVPAADQPCTRALPWTGHRTANEHGGTILENDCYRIQFELYSGYITSFIDKQTGQEIISDRAAVPVVIDEYYHDTWSHARNFFTDRMARFSDAAVSVTENGPLRATVKVVSRYNASTLTQYFSLTAGSDRLEVRAHIDWHEKHKMLKLAWPMAVQEPKAYYEIPFGVIERPADGEEEPGLTWTAVKGTDGGFALLNNNTYSSSVKGNTIYQTILRSPIYGDHGGPRTEESEFTDQGSFEFSYTLMPVTDSWHRVIREARLLNKPFTAFKETWHPGRLSARPYRGLDIDRPNLILSALKYSEDDTGLILRIYETDGQECDFRIDGDVLPRALCGHIKPRSVTTYFLKDSSDTWEEVLFTEFAAD